MTKAIDETWTGGNGDESDLCTIVADGAFVRIAIFESSHADENIEDDIARARLAACAPEALRLLLSVEWVAYDQGAEDTAVACLHCHGLKEPEEYSMSHSISLAVGGTIGHKPDCALVAVLRKAGLR